MTDYKLVPMAPTPEMVEAAEEAYMPFGDMDLSIRMAILTAPNAQEEPFMEWQPIETCPRESGTRYLITKDCGPNTLPSVSIVFRIDGKQGWIFDDSPGKTIEDYGYRATHWMPLPAPQTAGPD